MDAAAPPIASQALTFPRVKGTLHCGAHPLPALGEEYGTPLYIYSFDLIRDRVRAFQDAFREVDLLLAYSVKANGNLGLLKRLGELGTGADIVSGGELFRARRAQIPGNRILFAGVGKTDEELRAAVKEGIYSFNVETTAELHRLEELGEEMGRRVSFGVRINPDIKAPTPHEYTQTGHAEAKFGLPIPVAVGLYRWGATRPALRPRGIDVHVGSQITDPKPYKLALRATLDVARLLKKEDIELEYLDLGGGFGIPFEEGGTGMDIHALADSLLPLLKGSGLRLVLEPGRWLVGEAGILLARVLSLKKAGGRTFVITDAGMSELIRPSHYGAYHPILPVVEEPERKAERVDVVGPICESGDFLALDRALPLPRAGEYLAVMNAGAYGFSMASNYNARRRPAEVLVDGEETVLIRERESLEDLVRGEKLS